MTLRPIGRHPAHAEVRAKLEKEHDRLEKELGYTIPLDVPSEPKR